MRCSTRRSPIINLPIITPTPAALKSRRVLTSALNGDFSTRLMLIWLACAATVTLAPFDFTVPPPGEVGVHCLLRGVATTEPTHFVLNMLLFGPLGILVCRGRRRRLASSIPRRQPGFRGLVHRRVPAAFPAGSRSSLVDVAANTSGALLGLRHKSGDGRRDRTMCKSDGVRQRRGW